MTTRQKPISIRQKAILSFIIRFKRDSGGDSPTYREIMRGVGITSAAMGATERPGLGLRIARRPDAAFQPRRVPAGHRRPVALFRRSPRTAGDNPAAVLRRNQ